jgi:hypothetical protein
MPLPLVFAAIVTSAYAGPASIAPTAAATRSRFME